MPLTPEEDKILDVGEGGESGEGLPLMTELPAFEDWLPGYRPQAAFKGGIFKGYYWVADTSYEPPPGKAQGVMLPGEEKPDPYAVVAPEELPEYAPGFFKDVIARETDPRYKDRYLQPGQAFRIGNQLVQVNPRTGMIEAVNVGGKEPTARKPAPMGETVVDNDGNIWGWNGVDDYSIRMGYDPKQDYNRAMKEREFTQEEARLAREATRQAEIDKFNREQALWSRGLQEKGIEQERQSRLAQLQSQPMSWLQYAVESKTPPVVQPWMVPLSPKQYGFQIGQEIPGVVNRKQGTPLPPAPGTEPPSPNAMVAPEPGAAQVWQRGATPQTPQTEMEFDLRNLPELLRPSVQLQARMGPDAYQQYLGYERARTGQTPEGIDWRRRQTAPPGGGIRTLGWRR